MSGIATDIRRYRRFLRVARDAGEASPERDLVLANAPSLRAGRRSDAEALSSDGEHFLSG